MKAITKRQKEILDYIKLFITRNNFPPTVREVAENFKISIRAGYDHIKALEKKNISNMIQNVFVQ